MLSIVYVIVSSRNGSAVRDIRVVDGVDNKYLMRCQWVSEHDSVMDALVDPEVVLLSAVGTADGWSFKIRGESREAIAKLQQFRAGNDVPITLAEIYSVRAQSPRYELTDKQREALEMAFRYGYFDTPRESTLEQISNCRSIELLHDVFCGLSLRGVLSHEDGMASLIEPDSEPLVAKLDNSLSFRRGW